MANTLDIMYSPHTRVAYDDGVPVALIVENPDGTRVIYGVSGPLYIAPDDESTDDCVRDQFQLNRTH